MKKFVLMMFSLMSFVVSFAESEVVKENIDQIEKSNFEKDLFKDYKVECNAGSVIIVKWKTHCSFRNGGLPTGKILIDDKEIADVVCPFGDTENGFVSYKMDNDGEHTLSVQIKNSRDPSRYDAFLEISVIKSLVDTNGYYYQKLSDGTLKIVAPVKLKSSCFSIPEQVSVPFDGFYNVSQVEDSILKDNEQILSVLIPSTVVEIGNRAFLNCKNLKDVYCMAKAAHRIFEDTFMPNTKIHIYKNSYWYDAKEYEKLEIIDDLDDLSGINNVIVGKNSDSKRYLINGIEVNGNRLFGKQIFIFKGKKYVVR